MQRRYGRLQALGTALGLVLTISVSATPAAAQPPPNQEPFAPSARSAPAANAPVAVPDALPVEAPPQPLTQAQLEAEVRQLRSLVNQLSKQVKNAKPEPKKDEAPAAPAAPAPTWPPNPPGQSLPYNPPISKRFDSPATLESIKGSVKFGPGFEMRTEDSEFVIQFHDLTQFEYRGYQQGSQSNVKDGFLFPRQWWMLNGRITKPVGYFLSFAEGFDVLNLLDVFVDLDFSPKFRTRLGRFKTPFTYEFLVEPIQALVVPERSLFFNNFGQNRDLGVMAYGRLFDNKFDYAGGVFNGSRNGFVPLQDAKDVSAFINYRPWGDEENTLLENFNIGGSVFAGQRQQVPVPLSLRTIVATSGNSVAGVPFLTWNNNVRESGPMALWDLHVAYFLGGLAFIGEWAGGFENFAMNSSFRERTQIPIESFYLQTSYLVTGETRSSVGIVKPLNPVSFGRGKGWSGRGAIEPFCRFEFLDISGKVYSAGLVDQNLWANRVAGIHLGINWHMNQYMKVYLEWNHDEFNNPVLFAPGRRQTNSDLFLLRFQLYF